ncbi:MAG: recombination-associated protein RdgC [Pseudoxanthomonas spadix]|nr:MAG: recombination-associated protein RdgC [Pseudoxanthomonas spadix]
MFFRNLALFRIPNTLDFTSLDELLPVAELKPVGPLELASRGFVSPFGRGESALSHQIGAAIWLSVGGEDRILPAAVVNDVLAKKLAELEQKNGRKPGGKARRALKDEILHDLLPRAFVRPSRTDALIDLEHNFVAVDTSSKRTGENVVSEIRRAMGSFPALPLNAEIAVRSVLTGWVAGEPLPEGLEMGEECELREPVDGGAVVRVRDMAGMCGEITTHLEAGMQVTRLALTLNDHVSFVLGEDLVIRKFKLLDGAVESLENTEHDDLRAELDARFALLAGEVRGLFAVLEPALKLSKAEG